MESAGISPLPNPTDFEHEADIEIKLEQADIADADEADDGNTDYDTQLRAHVAELRARETKQEAPDADIADADEDDYDTQLRAHVAELRAREAEQEARDAELRAREAEQRAQEAEQRAEEAEKNAAREKKLRANYYNHQCRIKKEWDRQKVQLRIEISGLKAQIWEMKNDEQITIRNHREEIGKKNEQIESSEKDLNLFEAMIAARDKTIQQNESDYRTLLDDLISAKITIEDLKSAI